MTKWLQRFRRDPLRKLRLGRRGDDPRALDVTNLPEPTPVARATADRALRAFGAEASAGLPPAWAAEIRRRTLATDALTDPLDATLAGVDLPQSGRRWWVLPKLVHAVALLALFAGLVWLAVIAVAGYFQLTFTAPKLGQVPWPTLLVAGGALVALLTSGITALLGRAGARRAARLARTRIERALTATVDEIVVRPVTDVRDRLTAIRSQLGKTRR